MGYIETLLITNKINNLKYHNERMNKTRQLFFKCKEINLADFVEIQSNKRVRIVYEKEILKIEYFELVKRNFNTLKIVESDIEYELKYENRDKLNSLKDNKFDEVVIVKNGYITDTTISNLAFYNGNEWHTPNTPLLKGTKRAELLDKGFLKETSIKIDDLEKYQKVAMMNAIMGFYEVGSIKTAIK